MTGSTSKGSSGWVDLFPAEVQLTVLLYLNQSALMGGHRRVGPKDGLGLGLGLGMRRRLLQTQSRAVASCKDSRCTRLWGFHECIWIKDICK